MRNKKMQIAVIIGILMIGILLPSTIVIANDNYKNMHHSMMRTDFDTMHKYCERMEMHEECEEMMKNNNCHMMDLKNKR